MRRSKRYVSALLAASLLVTGVAGTAVADDLDDQLSQIESQMSEYQASEASWGQVIEEVMTKLRAIKADLDAANAKLKDIENQQAAINRQIEETQAAIDKAQARLHERQLILNKRVRAIYMNGQLSYMEVIMGSKSFGDFANRVELLKRIIKADYNLIKDIQQQKQAIEQQKAVLVAKRAELDKLAEEAKATRDAIDAKRAEQQKVLDEAKANKAAAQQMQSDLEAQRQQVKNLIQERVRAQQQAAASSGGTYTQGTGALSWPCNGVITSPYGYRTHPIFGTTIFHAGIDIGVDYGTPIHAADSGTVVYSGWISGYGNAVIIDHGNGLQTLYGHNDSLAVGEGQSVSKGEVIAYAGSTGNSTGPHCHFEVDQNGSPVDPMAYL
jgi:murein DD-endopeptidase MepM/ murein hydrolase activator NlpD